MYHRALCTTQTWARCLVTGIAQAVAPVRQRRGVLQYRQLDVLWINGVQRARLMLQHVRHPITVWLMASADKAWNDAALPLRRPTVWLPAAAAADGAASHGEQSVRASIAIAGRSRG